MSKQINNYVMVDSSQRKKDSTIIYDNKLYTLPEYPLEFASRSSLVKVYFNDNNFKVKDKIVLNNVKSKNVIMNNVLMIKKNSKFMRIYHPNHGMSYYGKFNETDENFFVKVDYVEKLPSQFDENILLSDTRDHYILRRENKLMIELSGIRGINNRRNNIGNIPINFLNRKHNVYLIFTKQNSVFKHDPNNYLIKLEKPSSINYADGINLIDLSNEVSNNTVYIKYLHLFGIPLNLLEFQKDKYFTILDVKQNYFVIDVEKKAIVDPNIRFYNNSDNIGGENVEEIIKSNIGGGNQIFVRKIINIEKGYPNPNNYVYELDKIYQNVSQVKIIGSIFPNAFSSLKSNHYHKNRLYWKNISDGDYIYYLEIDSNSPEELKNNIEKEFRSTLRLSYRNDVDNLLYDNKGHGKYHLVKVDIRNDNISLCSFKEIIVDSRNFIIPDNLIKLKVKQFWSHDCICFFYFTPNSTINVNKKIQYQLYRTSRFYDFTLEALIDIKTSILINIYRKTFDGNIINEIKSINTNESLLNFTFDYSNNIVHQENHCLKEKTIIITDKFIDPREVNRILIYQIVKVIDSDNYLIKKLSQNKFLMVYDGFVFNHSDISSLESFITFIESDIVYPLTVKIYHENHDMDESSYIIIDSPVSINGISKKSLNRKHSIVKIINSNEYIIQLHQFERKETDSFSASIRIEYPDKFQLLFNYPDTIGELLGFSNVGEVSSITPFSHCIRNKDNYLDCEINRISKLSKIHHDYFYICSPELSAINNTQPVSNVFAIGQWTKGFREELYYNTILPTIKTFDPPIKSLDKIHFTICHPDGSLIEFRGQDHSFLLEIIEEKIIE
jgi:hypothetical protein